MIKYFSSFRLIQTLLSLIGSIYVLTVYKTSKVNLKNRNKIENLLERNESFIYSFWHDQLLMCPLTWQSNSNIKVLISKHRDGDIIAQLISNLGFEAIRGSTHKTNKIKNKGGLLSARKMIKSLKNGISIGISPDGPKGPRHKVSEGILSISRLSESVILPVGIGFKKKWVLNTWDKFIIPKPFNEITVIWGDPIPAITNEKNNHQFKTKLESKMNNLTAQANKNYK
ncbi:lysophospholipid acyltransferase family protein [Pelagibacteraceae bacterium]|nr:lysophospholipid acyltransferase family protein [Pelagibacteraceae bacterium]